MSLNIIDIIKMEIKMKKIFTLAFMFCFVLAEDEFFEPKTSIGGYGELHYDMKKTDSFDNEIGKLDFHRFIFYIKHQFSEKWSMMSEVEIEHNMVYSEGDGGYLAMEQAFLNYWNGKWGWQGGVILVPSGIINEYHEPPTFMSVERPEYNKYIIPTTWFDNGFAFYGTMSDFNWKVAFTGDLDGDAISNGIRSARMKGVSSSTTSWTKTAQGSWTGMTGLKVGGSMAMNDAPATPLGDDMDCGMNGDEVCGYAIEREAVGFNLTEFNATYSSNNFYARMEYGMMGYTNNLYQERNTMDPDGQANSGDEYDVGSIKEYKSSSGYYLDLGYDIADLIGCGDDTNLYLWMRTSSYNKDDAEDPKEISLFGVTYKPMNNISFKFETGTAGDDDVMRLGIGYMF